MALDTIEEAVAAVARGEFVVVVDDDDRENEGDLIAAAETITPAQVAFMIRHTSGILCAPMEPRRAERLHLPPMVANNRDPMRTAFTVSVDYREGLTTGISATERAGTLRALAADGAMPGDFVRPGHVFPLIGKPGGVLARSGHTEAATDLARLAGLKEVGVLAEIVNENGTVKRLPELVDFAREHGLKIVSIEDMIEYRVRHEPFVQRVKTVPLATLAGPAEAHVYRSAFEAVQHVAVVVGSVGDGRDVPCRIHREDLLEDLFGRPNAMQWLEASLQRFAALGRGVVVLLREADVAGGGRTAMVAGQEMHGSNQARIERWREIGLGAQILRDLGVRSIRLVATHQRDYVGLSGFGIEISATEIVPG
jgi:3,4-dihydroxy 2-butanone 4-phosphate synthase/GTP cyclohydrolase II